MKRILAGLFIFVLLGLVFSASLALAERPRTAQRTYDISKEVTLTGKVSSVLVRPEPGMVSGSHLILSVGAARVDACLGRFALLGRDALALEAGREIEVTGLLQTVHEKQIMLVRMVKVDGRTYLIRNEHGVPVSPQSRQWAAQKGEAR
jgi:hypothetical protein